MAASTMTYEDRLAARFARMCGVALSVDEIKSLDDNSDDEQQPPITDTKGKVDINQLLVDLLGLLGVKIDTSGGEKAFKQNLYAATIAKIRDLTAPGSQTQSNNANASGNPGGKTTKAQNPLLTGQVPQGTMEPVPMMFSLSSIEQIGDHHAKGIALGLAVEAETIRKNNEQSNLAAVRQREQKLSEAYGRRQIIINRILRLAPNMRSQIDLMLGTPSAVFSTDVHGQITDPVESSLRRLELQLTAALKVAESTVTTAPTASESDDAVECLAKFMR